MDLQRCTSWESTGSDDALLEWCLGYSKVGQNATLTEAFTWEICVHTSERASVDGGVTERVDWSAGVDDRVMEWGFSGVIKKLEWLE